MALRLAMLWAAGDLRLQADEIRYVYLGVGWSRLGFYGTSLYYLWPPAYPAFLAVLLGALGADALLAARLLQVGLSSVIGASVMLLAWRMFSRRACLVAGLLWAVHLPLVGYSHTLWPETLFLAVLLPAVVLLRELLEDAGPADRIPWRLLAAGLLLGAGCLVKEASLPLAALFVIALLFEPRAAPRGRRVFAATSLTLAVLVVVLPWALRNAEVFGRAVPSGASLGQNLFWGVNAQYVNFDYVWLQPERLYAPDDFVYRSFVEPPAGAPWERSDAPNLIDRDREMTRRGLAFARAHPGYVLRSRVKKLADWVTPLSFFVRHHQLGIYEGVLARDPVRKGLVLAAVLTTALILAGAIPGFFLGLSDRASRVTVLAVLLCFGSSALIVSMSRFRVPAEPLLIVLCAGFLAHGAPGWRVRRGATLAAGACGLALAALWWLNAREIGRVLGSVL